MANRTKAALVAVTMVAIVATAFFLLQGGFGGGHGRFDRTIFVMGLPWAAMPWPYVVIRYDFVWLIGLPWVLNLASVLLIVSAIRAARAKQVNRTPAPRI
jgi:NADH:ubiquinone oxidoreductase subunit 5 (subunit L)/multisubunit Na+/H+ antiporter MnhA subunit